MKFNFEAKSLDDISCVEKIRAHEIAGIMAAACEEMEENYKDYIFIPEEGKNKGREGLHRGKILQRLLRDITNEQEIIMVCFTLDLIEGKMQRSIDRKNMSNVLLGGLKEAVDSFFANKEKKQEAATPAKPDVGE